VLVTERRGSVHLVHSEVFTDGQDDLTRQRIRQVAGTFATPEDAWACAHEMVGADDTIDASIEVIGDFVIPPPDGLPSRDFQTLHVDFGVPLSAVVPMDVARFTALHVPASVESATAITRFVPLRALLGAQSWPDRNELVRRFAAYGESHGTWKSDAGYAEGSLARIIEAALGQPPVLPSVRADPDFLCGTEFASLADEMLFFTQRDFSIDAVVIEIRLQPGELLVFDNLALAHGRKGSRAPGELHQRVFGHRALDRREQIKLRDGVLANFINLRDGSAAPSDHAADRSSRRTRAVAPGSCRDLRSRVMRLLGARDPRAQRTWTICRAETPLVRARPFPTAGLRSMVDRPAQDEVASSRERHSPRTTVWRCPIRRQQFPPPWISAAERPS
jgi:hypothetical protein